jgi:hypothetical protein
MKEDMPELLIWELQEDYELITLRIRVELQVTWLLKFCVDKIILMQQIFSLLELLLISLCLEKDLIMEKVENKFEIKY